MKYSNYFLIVFIMSIFACKTLTPPQSLTIDGMTLTLPEGFTEFQKDNSMGFDGIPVLQNWYQKKDGSNTVSLKINRFDIAHISEEDPIYLAEMCLAHYRNFYSEGHEKEFTYSETTPLSINGKNGSFLTFDDTSDPQHKLKGEMVALKSGKKIIVLHYTDFAEHFEQGKADWESLKSSIKINQ